MIDIDLDVKDGMLVTEVTLAGVVVLRETVDVGELFALED